MNDKEVRSILMQIHKVEISEGRMIRRKEMQKHLNEGISFSDKAVLIRAWQDGYFQRLKNVGYRIK